jgi:tripartite-type tricarboxylate transporter receptor subunit TctC
MLLGAHRHAIVSGKEDTTAGFAGNESPRNEKGDRIMKTPLLCLAGAVALTAAALSPLPADAQSFAGKTITVYIPVGPGGGYDAYGRMAAAHMGRHLPGNPTIIASNMPGGGGRKLANYMYNAAPKDGSAFAVIHHTTVYDAAFGSKGVQYDSTKLNWIGSMASATLFVVVNADTGIKSIEDAKKKQITVGATGRGATSFQFLSLTKNMFGAKFKIVSGYKGARAIYMAVERNELHGTGGMTWATFRNNYGHLLKGNKVNVLAQIGLEKHPDLKGVPSLQDMAKTDEERKILDFVLSGLKITRPFMMPPAAPEAVVAAFRKAMDEVVKDPKLIAEAAKRRFELDPVSGAQVQKMVEQIYGAPADIKAKARKLLTSG